MERPAEVEHHIVGDVHQRRDGPKPHRPQPPLKPGGARAIPHTADDAADEDGAGHLLLACGKGAVDGGARLPHRGYVVDLPRAEGAEASRSEIAGDALHAETVRPVGGDRHIKHRPLEPQRHRRRCADLPWALELDDAAVVLAHAQFMGGAQHAAALHPADHRPLEHLAGGRDHRPLRRENAVDASPGVGGAAHHPEGAVASAHGAQFEAVGVGMGLACLHIGDGEGGEAFGRVLHRLHLEADHGEGVGDGGGIRIGGEMLPQPGQSELHRDRPAKVVGTSRGRKP